MNVSDIQIPNVPNPASLGSPVDMYRDADQMMLKNLEHYCARLVKIKDRSSGRLVPFTWGGEQRFVHNKFEEQKNRTGMVRALVLKPRKRGISTYIGARFYHDTSLGYGVRTSILTHEDAATQNLFEMVRLIHENMEPDYRPRATSDRQDGLDFGGLYSSYRLATAKTKGTGRSDTIRRFHGCLGPDTPVIDPVSGKLRPMRSFKLGDLVRTHTGVVAAVSFISHQRKAAYHLTLKGLRDFPLTTTGEHRFWTTDGWRRLDQIMVGQEIGFPVRSITQEHPGWPFRLPDSVRPQGGGSQEVGPDAIQPSYALGRIVGLYLAEGSIVKQSTGAFSGVSFSVHYNEAKRTEQWLDALNDCFVSRRTAYRKNCKTAVVVAYGRSFATFLNGICGRVESKQVPTNWRQMGRDFVEGMVEGYLSGDGHVSPERDRRISATSIRSAITIGIRDAIASLGYGWASIEYKEAAIRHGRNEQEAWTLRLCGSGVDELSKKLGKTSTPRKRADNGNYGTVQVAGGYAWVPVVSIADIGDTEVMDFEVDHEDHSYCILHGATHNSEAAFWPESGDHDSGIIQAIPREFDTESVLESTGNGVGGMFYRMWQQAEKGLGDYMTVFFPWFWAVDYRATVPKHFEPSKEEAEYAETYNLDMEQLAWLRAKNAELGGEIDEICWKFHQEYPADAVDAFQTGGVKSYIPSRYVVKARHRKVETFDFQPVILGMDVARGGEDTCRIVDRQGRRAGGHVDLTFQTDDLTIAADHLVRTIRQLQAKGVKVKRAYVDVTGIGAGVVDHIHALYDDLREVVVGINFGSAATEDRKYANKRAEMWGRMKEWFMDKSGVQIPDKDDWQRHICSVSEPGTVQGGTRYDAATRLVLESKENLKTRLKLSPDGGDALGLTLAEELPPDRVEEEGEPDFMRKVRIAQKRAQFSPLNVR